MQIDDRFRTLLSILHEGGAYGYWWQAEGKRSTWWPVNSPAPVPDTALNYYFGVHPTTIIPTTDQHGEPKPPQGVRSQIPLIAAINCVFAEFDLKDFSNYDMIDLLSWIVSNPCAIDMYQAPIPSVIIKSGGGYHCYWLLEESYPLIENSDARVLAQHLQAAWVRFVGSDKGSKDLCRVLRIPGTRNRKKNDQGLWLYDDGNGDPVAVEFVKYDLDQCYPLQGLIDLCTASGAWDDPKLNPTTNGHTNGHSVQMAGNLDPEIQHWAKAKLTEIATSVALQKEGGRNNQLLAAATLAGGLLSYIGAGEIERVLSASSSLPAKEALTTIQNGLKIGSGESSISGKGPLEPPAQPVYRDGVACCPHHPGHALVKAQKGTGWYCAQARSCFWWLGATYQPPKNASLTSLSSVSRDSQTGETTSETAKSYGPPQLLDEDEIDALEPPEWLIEGVIPAREITLLVAPNDTGKTFLTVDIMMRVCHFYPGCYIAAEDGRGVRSRKKAWEQHYGIERSARNGNFHMWNEELLLTDTDAVDTFIAWMAPINPELIVIDTLSQCIPGVDENSSKEITGVLKQIKRIQKSLNCAVIVLHHTTKAEGSYRGSSSLPSNTFGHITLQNDDGAIKMEFKRIKGMQKMDPLYFRLVSVDIGDVLPSAVPLPAANVAKDESTLTPNQTLFLEHLSLMTDADDGASPTTLQEVSGISKSTLYKCMAALKTMDAIADGRGSRMIISQKGRKLLSQSSKNPEFRMRPSGPDESVFRVNPALERAPKTPDLSQTRSLTVSENEQKVSPPFEAKVSRESLKSHESLTSENNVFSPSLTSVSSNNSAFGREVSSVSKESHGVLGIVSPLVSRSLSLLRERERETKRPNQNQETKTNGYRITSDDDSLFHTEP